MKLILRQAALTLLSFGLLYGVMLALALLIAPDIEQPGVLDAWSAGGTVYLTPPKYGFLRRDILNVPDRKVIMVGASNTGIGFRPNEIQPMVPCAKVSNLSIGASNITEVRQMIDLVLGSQNEAARQTDTFVIGVWFGMFVDTDLLWPGLERAHGDTDLDIERYRYGFYRRTPDGPVPVLSPGWLHLEVTLIRPYLLLEKVARWATAGARSVFLARDPNLTDAEREAQVFTESGKAAARAFWYKTMGGDRTISASEVALLRQTIERVLQVGGKVVLADLPIPAWNGNSSPYEPGYLTAVQGPVFAEFAGRPGFAALKMPDLTADNDYSDEVHPKPHLAAIWATRLAALLDPLVCGKPAGTASAAPGPGIATASSTLAAEPGTAKPNQ